MIRPETSVVTFIDGSISDLEIMVAGLDANSVYYVLDPKRDGLTQMVGILAEYSNLSAIHVLSHGAVAGLQLGSSWVDGASLDRYADELAAFGTALSVSGDLLLYGCNVAQGELGQQFIERIAEFVNFVTRFELGLQIADLRMRHDER